MAVVVPAKLRGWLRFGLGVGIVVGDHDLEILVARVRPAGLSIRGHLRVPNYRQRPVGDWGGEIAEFLSACHASSVPAIVVLPRSQVVARTLSMPGVRDEDAGRAVELQLDNLHPSPAEKLSWAFQRIAATSTFSVALVERQDIDYYSALFSEAGLRLAGFTWSGSALYHAARLADAPPPAQVLAVRDLRVAAQSGSAEIYVESPSHPLYNARFLMPLDRAVALAVSETRLESGVEAVDWVDLLPPWQSAPDLLDLSDAGRARIALAWAAALVSACPHLGAPLNLLPEELRYQSSRLALVPTFALLLVLFGLGTALLAQETWLDRGYSRTLRERIHRIEPTARRVETLDRHIADSAARIRMLDDFRNRSRQDLDVLLELTKLIPPPASLDSIVLSRTDVQISGEIGQAEGLLKVLDGSPLFENSEFSSQVGRRENNEQFHIRTQRRHAKAPAGGAK